MRYIIVLLFLLPSLGLTCKNWLPRSEVIKAINKEPNAGSITCKQRPNEKCICFDNVDWETYLLKIVNVDNYEKPLFADKEIEQDCANEINCSLLISLKEIDWGSSILGSIMGQVTLLIAISLRGKIGKAMERIREDINDEVKAYAKGD